MTSELKSEEIIKSEEIQKKVENNELLKKKENENKLLNLHNKLLSRTSSPYGSYISCAKYQNEEENLINENQKTRTISRLSDFADDNNSYYGESVDDQNNASDFHYQSSFSVAEYPDAFYNENIINYLPIPPDGGYGWIIVAAAFMSNLIVDGIANSFGPFMLSYQTTFNSTKAETSLIGSLLIGAYLLSGPIAGSLSNKYNPKKVVIGGSILSSFAFVLSTLSPNIFIHYIVYGLVGGIGFGFIYLPAIVCVSQYFEKKRALATGISVAGSGVGTFLMPLFCKTLIEMFNWRTTLYILAGIILICGVIGVVYKPVPVPNNQIKLNEKIKQQMLLEALSKADLSKDEDIQSSNYDDDNNTLQNDEDLSVLKSETNQNRVQTTNQAYTNSDKENIQPLLSNAEKNEIELYNRASTPVTKTQLSPITEHRLLNKNQFGQTSTVDGNTGETSRLNRLSTTSRNDKSTLASMNSEFNLIANGIEFKYSRPNLTNQLSRISARSYAQSLSRISQGPYSIKAGDSVMSVALSGVDPKEFHRPFSRRDIFLQGSISNLKNFEHEGCDYKAYREKQSISIPASVVTQSLAKLNVGTGDLADFSSKISESRNSKINVGLNFRNEEETLTVLNPNNRLFRWISFPIRSALLEMIDINLLYEPVMQVICLSNILGMIGFYVPFVFVIDLAGEKNINTAQATLLLSVIGITNTFGRVFFGWIADKQWLSALFLNNWSLLTCGLITFICPFAPNFFWLIVYAIFFGFIVAAYICLTSIVLSDLLGIERLTNSFGLLVVSRGFASLLGTPLAGIVYDSTKSYNASFYFSGTLIFLSGLVSCTIPILHRHQRSKFQNEGDYQISKKSNDVDIEIQSGKLSVLTERSEENLTEYQQTIQSLTQKNQLMNELEEYKQKTRKLNSKPEKLPVS